MKDHLQQQRIFSDNTPLIKNEISQVNMGAHIFENRSDCNDISFSRHCSCPNCVTHRFSCAS